ncbi:hypothetical protein [Nevskia soli]|uniref:hypothetical protein n=1 Tax=Nevskia soli TaxID=418856 RepID=UPI0012F8616A|nr:hypothetical protein [Nevskia soli]
MSPTRKAAVQLAALSSHDRNWIWKRLESGERDKIKPALDEFLRIPPAALTVELHKMRNASIPSPRVRRSDDSDLASVRLAATKEVVPLVRSLPPASVALLMQVENWRWSEDVLRSLDLPSRNVVKELLARDKSAQNVVLAEWLVVQLAARIRTERSRLGPPDQKFDSLVGIAD